MAGVTRVAMSTKNVQCLIQDMVQVQELKSKLKGKEAAMEEIKLTLEQSNVNRTVPDRALKTAAIMENREDKSVALASVLKIFIQNRGTPVMRWSNETK